MKEGQGSHPSPTELASQRKTPPEQGGAHKESNVNTPLASLTQEQQGWYKRPHKEDKEKKKERDRRYRQENKEKLKDYQKHYYQKRKEQRAADLTQIEQKQHEAIQIYPSPKTG